MNRGVALGVKLALIVVAMGLCIYTLVNNFGPETIPARMGAACIILALFIGNRIASARERKAK